MQVIHPLSDEVINKIAAGEVVERPASVVKELVENAIDAGAKHIDIEIKDGGLGLIAVRDNGSGMSIDDAPYAVMRHATSKIKASEDLFAIDTMGFRGEALASISSVSQFHMSSAAAGGQGFALHFDSGKPIVVANEAPRGTTVRVGDLFYNIPARRAFLKSTATEFSFITEVVQSYALAYLDVGFSLTHNNKRLWHVDAESNLDRWQALQQRLQVFGIGEQRLVPMEKAGSHAKVWGVVSPPGVEKTTAKWLFTFINGRWVKDKALRFAIQRGYHTHLLKGRYPVCVLFLDIDPSLVDINVHPAKTEVRLQYQQDIQQVIATGIREAIRQGDWGLAETAVTDVFARDDEAAPKPDFVATPKPTFHTSKPEATSRVTTSTTSVRQTFAALDKQPKLTAMPDLTLGLGRFAESKLSGPQFPWHEAEYLGQFKQLYLLFSCQDHLLVVDQHAFHERILFERFSASPDLMNQSQRCLMPEVVHLGAERCEQLQRLMPQLEKRGFEICLLDQDNVEVLAIPLLLARADLEQVLHDMVANEAEASAAEIHILATMACHAAVRGGDVLTPEQVENLLREATTVDFYHNCPHGRPVFKWWSPGQVAGWFERI